MGTRQRAIKARPLLGFSGGQRLGGDGSGGGDRPCSVASRAGHTSLLLGGTGRMKAATPRVGAIPTHATTQPAADGGHGMPSQDGQCCVHNAPTVI